MGIAVLSGEFNLFLLCSETSEVLQYTATESEDVEKVRVCCIYLFIFFKLPGLKYEEKVLS